MLRAARGVTVIGFLLAAAPAAGAGAGEKLCVLTPVDFAAFGTTVDGKPHVNLDQDGENAYCVYRGKSGAMGGVELDVFDPAGDSPAAVAGTFRTVLQSSPGATYAPEGVADADESMFSLSVPQPGYPAFAANAVRRGSLVFTISLPASAQAKTELLQLSELVLKRLPK